MHRVIVSLLIGFSVAALSGPGLAQSKQGTVTVPAPTSPDYAGLFPPLKNPASADQIREYIRISGDMEKYRTRLINTVDKVRYIGKPYWPESFWSSIKEEMRKADLVPMFIVLFQHGISRELIQEVLNTYQHVGADHFAGTPAWVKLNEAELAMQADTQQVMLRETQEIIERVYQVYKPQIKAARTKYMAEHPDWKE